MHARGYATPIVGGGGPFRPSQHSGRLDSGHDSAIPAPTQSVRRICANAPKAFGYIHSDESLPVPPERLKLVLDLDNTLLQAANIKKFDCELPYRVDDSFADLLYPVRAGRSQTKAREMDLIALECNYGNYFYVKYRPLVREFLDLLRPYFSFSVHTNAVKEYADKVCDYLERTAYHANDGSPSGRREKLFGSRVVPRLEGPVTHHVKSIARVDEVGGCQNPMRMLIIDDRQDVWPDNLRKNLIKCTAYNFLDEQEEALQNAYKELPPMEQPLKDVAPTPNLERPSTLKKHSRYTHVDVDVQLPYIARFLKRSALEYYRKLNGGTPLANLDIRDIIQEEQKKILKGKVILLVGFPKERRPRGSYYTNTFYHHADFAEFAERLGAMVVSSAERPDITHAVCFSPFAPVPNETFQKLDARRVTERVNYEIVSPLWLLACHVLLLPVPEASFRVHHEDQAREMSDGVLQTDIFFKIKDEIQAAKETKEWPTWIPKPIITRQLELDKLEASNHTHERVQHVKQKITAVQNPNRGDPRQDPRLAETAEPQRQRAPSAHAPRTSASPSRPPGWQQSRGPPPSRGGGRSGGRPY